MVAHARVEANDSGRHVTFNAGTATAAGSVVGMLGDVGSNLGVAALANSVVRRSRLHVAIDITRVRLYVTGDTCDTALQKALALP